MKHPKSYDTTPETSKRMSRVRLKKGPTETALAKAPRRRGYRSRPDHPAPPGPQWDPIPPPP